MWRKIAFLFVLAAWLPALADADDAEQLKYAGIPVEFAQWAPKDPTFAYSDLDISPQRREALRGKELPYLERLFKVRIQRLPDGSIEETISVARLFMTQAGIANYGNLEFWVDASSQTATIEQAYALLPGGRRVSVEPQAIQLVADSTDDIFTDSFQAIVPFSGLVPKAMTVLVVKIRQEGSARPLPWSRVYRPQWLVPLEEFDFHLAWSANSAPPQWQSDYERLTCEPVGDRSVHCFALENPAYPRDPHVRYRDAVPSLIVAEKTTWGGLARQVRALVDSALSDDPSLQGTLDKLLEGTGGDPERLDRIHQFVSQDIRYVGLEQGVGDVVPRPTNLTLRRRYGDCKDKTTLFVDLAQRAGFDVYPVLTSSTRSDPVKLLIPAAGYFDHMVACVVIAADKEQCVDLTDPYGPYDSLSGYVQGAIRLDLIDGPSAPRTLPVTPYLRTIEVETVTHVKRDGSIEERQTRTYLGQHAASLRSTLQPMSQSERQKWILDRYHETVNDTVNPTFDVAGIDDVRSPIAIRSLTLFPIFNPGATIYAEYETELARAPQQLQTGNTAHEYSFSGVSYRGNSLFYLPMGKRATFAGPKLNFKTPFGTLHRDYQMSSASVRVSTELSMPRATIPLDAIPRFNRFLDYIAQNAKIWFSMVSTAEP